MDPIPAGLLIAWMEGVGYKVHGSGQGVGF